jgi:hypothetical protein
VTQGRRVYLDEDGLLTLAEGDYGREANGRWVVRPPGQPAGELFEHQVEEHEDGTITVSPSIMLRLGTGRNWHGYLERGVWRDA